MLTRLCFFILFWACFYGVGFTQTASLDGKWQGEVKQGSSTFRYEFLLTQEAEGAVSGQSKSWSADGRDTAIFSLTGKWVGDSLILREWKQIIPQQVWCKKRIGLVVTGANASGVWFANGCKSGTVAMVRSGIDEQVWNGISPMVGPWTGYLGQSDRDYGFYLHFELHANGTGIGQIESEGNGGMATMNLRWEHEGNQLIFKELGVENQSDPDWRWCVKSGQLNLDLGANRKVLNGDWQGYINGYSQETGACAPGRMYLEQPVPLPEEQPIVAKAINSYTEKTERTVNAGRVLTVQSPNLWIIVWDNGTVDGDVLDLYLNGEKIVDQHRVSKQKYRIPVTLKKEENLLVLHALDLGDIHPNTVAVAVDDGVKEQTVIISSNLTESGAALVRWFNVDK